MSNRWEGKQEPVSDEENGSRQNLSDKIMFEKKNYSRVSLGKTEPQDREEASLSETAVQPKKEADKEKKRTEEKRILPKLVIRFCPRLV